MKINASVRLKASKPFKKGDPVKWRMRDSGPYKDGFIESIDKDSAFVLPLKEDAISIPLLNLEHAQ